MNYSFIRICRCASVITLCALLLALSLPCAQADSTWVYAVQISAVVQTSPPKITLNWEPDMDGAVSYTVSRKSKEATNWGPRTLLSGSLTNYTDTNVAAGVTYEYQIYKVATLGYIGFGHIYTGINAPLIESRGTVLQIVATNSAISPSNELGRLQTDLVDDGWKVIRHDVSSNGSPSNSLTGAINPKYGLWTIAFGNGLGRATTHGLGALLQDTANAGGFFLETTDAGSITLTPASP
jgi:hypothetical protein